MKTQQFIRQILSLPNAVKTNQYTAFQAIVCTAILAIVIFGGLLIINPTALKD